VTDEPGKLFREAWIAGVRQHFPGDPKPSMVVPWEETPAWERACAASAEKMIKALWDTSRGAAGRLTEIQRGQFVAASWNAQIYRHVPDPKPSYVAPWEQLPEWQQHVDTAIFDAIARDNPRADDLKAILS
jgi:hypothetical protein